MKLTSLKIIGFQCFEDETSVDLDSFTTLIGANGCGKSAVLDALCRLFGISTSLRSIRRSDFHLPSGKTYDDFEELTLSLEVRLDFPELEGEPEPGNAVPECFNQMAIEAEGETPFCRLRLSAIWYRWVARVGRTRPTRVATRREVYPFQAFETSCDFFL